MPVTDDFVLGQMSVADLGAVSVFDGSKMWFRFINIIVNSGEENTECSVINHNLTAWLIVLFVGESVGESKRIFTTPHLSDNPNLHESQT